MTSGAVASWTISEFEPKMERLSITLPADMARMVRDMVEQGVYGSTSEVVRDALRDWQGSDRSRAERLASLRNRIEAADVDPSLSLTEADLDRHFAERVARALAPSDHGA